MTELHSNLRSLYKSDEGFKAVMAWYDDLMSQVRVPYTTCKVVTRFGKTHILRCGPQDGRPVILVQAIAGSIPMWRNLFTALSKQHLVFALDTNGQPGLSDPNPLSYFNSDYIDWLCDVQDGLRVGASDFIGISSGGWNVMRLAVDHPDRVGRVVMLSPIGVSNVRLPWKIWINRVMKTSKGISVLEDELTAKSISSPSAGGSFGSFDRQVARAMALCTRHFCLARSLNICNPASDKIAIGRMVRLMRRFLLSEPKATLRRVRAPCLILFGEHEILYNPRKVVRRVEALIPNAHCEIIESSGHGCIYDQPQRTAELILEFFNNSFCN